MSRRVIVLAFALALFLAGVSAGQEHPNGARGFAADKAFQVGDVDHVNLFNGNLVLTIPLGQTYPVNSGLSYSLGLSYNSSVWDFQERMSWPSGTTFTQAIPNRRSNAGLGWMVSLGRLNPETEPDVDSIRDTYLSPDGSLHTFYPTLHEGESPTANISYSRDGSYLRLRKGLGQAEIEFPNGQIHTFRSDGLLSKIRDPFDNQVLVDYTVANRWRISDSRGRFHDVFFQTLSGYPQTVERIELAAFGGARPTYTFSYTQPTIERDCRHTDHNDPSGQGLSYTVAVPLLASVNLPDGSSWAMPEYYLHNSGGAECASGMIKGLRLPTLGYLEWNYQDYVYPGDSSTKKLRPKWHGCWTRGAQAACLMVTS